MDIDSTNQFFHYHDPVPPGDTAEELSQYHFRSLMYTLEDVQEYDFVSLYARGGGFGSKVFTYMEAGLPIIVDKYATGSSRLVNEYGNGLAVEENQLDHLSTILAAQQYDELTDGVIRAQESLSLENQAAWLQDLYEKAGAGNTAVSQS